MRQARPRGTAPAEHQNDFTVARRGRGRCSACRSARTRLRRPAYCAAMGLIGNGFMMFGYVIGLLPVTGIQLPLISSTATTWWRTRREQTRRRPARCGNRPPNDYLTNHRAGRAAACVQEGQRKPGTRAGTAQRAASGGGGHRTWRGGPYCGKRLTRSRPVEEQSGPGEGVRRRLPSASPSPAGPCRGHGGCRCSAPWHPGCGSPTCGYGPAADHARNYRRPWCGTGHGLGITSAAGLARPRWAGRLITNKVGRAAPRRVLSAAPTPRC